MGSNDTRKIGKRSLQAQNWSLDINPHKSTKRAKAKERQAGKKLASEESWYCHKCSVEVYQYRCKHCGKNQRENK